MDRLLTRYVRALRAAGVEASPAETLDAVRTLGVVGLDDRQALKMALGIVLAKSAAEKSAHVQHGLAVDFVAMRAVQHVFDTADRHTQTRPRDRLDAGAHMPQQRFDIAPVQVVHGRVVKQRADQLHVVATHGHSPERRVARHRIALGRPSLGAAAYFQTHAWRPCQGTYASPCLLPTQARLG